MTTIADRVEETTETAGLGPFALLGATAGHRRFGAAFANGAAGLRYAVESEDRALWEILVGTYADNELSRDAVVVSSAGAGVPINWPAGIKRIWSNADAAYLNTEWLGAYAWGGRPDATLYAGKTFTCTDVGIAGCLMRSDGVRWYPQGGRVVLYALGPQVVIPNDTEVNEALRFTVFGELQGPQGTLELEGTIYFGGGTSFTKTVRVQYGGTQFSSRSTNSGAMTYGLAKIHNRNNVASQMCNSDFHQPYGDLSQPLFGSVDTSVDQDIVLSVQKSGAAAQAIVRTLKLTLVTP